MQFCLKRIPDYSVCIIHYFMVVVSNKQLYIIFFIFSETRQVCETKECILAASSILKAMDQTVDPCTDFYKYACGGWERDTPIPPGYSMWDRIQELSYTNLHHLKDILGNQRGTNFVFICTPILVQPCFARDARFFSLNILMLRFFFIL